jgi:two-component system, NtrC family, sensor histidine kinase PilS
LIADSYSLVNFVSALSTHALPHGLLRRQVLPACVVLLDIAALVVLLYLSGGVRSGLGLVVLVTVASGSVLITNRLSLVIAASATILVLAEEFLLSVTHPQLFTDYFQGGMLGILFFAASVSIQRLSRRLWQSEIMALTREVEVADLERINQSIVARMRTGIIVVDAQDRIRLINQSARSLLGIADAPDATPAVLPIPIQERLTAWRSDIGTRSGPFQLSRTTPEVRANFSAVRTDQADGEVIVFLEDTTEIQHQAQQLKLAALGRMSGTIAHEVRNPLGAISHAAQLLAESEHLDTADTRLTDIINAHCKRLNGVVESVLELSRRRPPSPVRINLAQWLDEFVTQFKQTGMDSADIHVAVRPDSTEIRVDPTQLGQALTNLVQNGLRYSIGRVGRAEVRLEGGIDTSTDRPFLNVIDFGSGVAEDMVENLFEPFFTTEQAGTGLGLYITREICEVNQARITYLRDIEGGSCFRISFAHPDRITA